MEGNGKRGKLTARFSQASVLLPSNLSLAFLSNFEDEAPFTPFSVVLSDNLYSSIPRGFVFLQPDNPRYPASLQFLCPHYTY